MICHHLCCCLCPIQKTAWYLRKNSLRLLVSCCSLSFSVLCRNLSTGQFTDCERCVQFNRVVFHHVYNSIFFREIIQMAGHSGGSASTTIIHLTGCSLLSSMMAFRERDATCCAWTTLLQYDRFALSTFQVLIDSFHCTTSLDVTCCAWTTLLQYSS